MTVFLFLAAALCGYLVAGLNPAILLSRAVYHKDIRECGSGNAGFTNFKRTFGGRLAWCVMLLDLAKAACVVALFSYLLSRRGIDAQLGAGFTGIFCLLGHAYPLQFHFKGGKGFLVTLSTVFVIDWRVGLIATGVMILLLLTTRYMSLSTTAALLLSPTLLILFDASLSSVLMMTFCALFVAIRHRENYKRLLHGCEPKFSFARQAK